MRRAGRLLARLRGGPGASALPGQQRSLPFSSSSALEGVTAAVDQPRTQLAALRRAPPAAWQAHWRRGFADDASTLAPCERGAEEQQENKVDAKLRAAGADGAAAVLAVIEEHAESFTELNVVSALRAFADASRGGGGGMSADEIVRSSGFQALVDMVLAGMQRFPPPLLCEAVHACGAVGAREEMLLDEIGRHIMRPELIASLTPAHICSLASGFAALDHSPSLVLFETLAARAAEVGREFSPEQREEVSAAYEALGYARKAPF